MPFHESSLMQPSRAADWYRGRASSCAQLGSCLRAPVAANSALIAPETFLTTLSEV